MPAPDVNSRIITFVLQKIILFDIEYVISGIILCTACRFERDVAVNVMVVAAISATFYRIRVADSKARRVYRTL